ncbi:MAG: RagB/SusD family nutrient uptake outer membrane protein [Duncaniella sp.]|nr:RagB/SusD family nutrient uptake outer membrane protein [Duncaniella sp.]MDE6328126.1 RagB/SusD family nutrient uptake outer membrane protein [Duncaniella sp.]MDE6466995.1 RagB/SusD family nutrient uptake outer membrane protein [Duncaniella sp.]MDE6573271.1 RagB/SusD family nutrient uptake outer membrane protein [Duncaniella sp.]
MKLYKSIAYAAVAAFVMSGTASCSLDEENLSGVSTSQEWTTPGGFEKKINDCYFDLVRIIYGQAEDTYVLVAEGGTDIWQDANADGTNGNWSKILRYDGFGSSTSLCDESYSGFYGVLSACNAAIFYADKVEGLTEERRNALVAEAHFIRAHVLFNIVEVWGGKYLPTKPNSAPGSSLSCSKVNDFYKVILEDLRFAMNNLPVTQEVRGHVVRAAAYHLYAKACLTYSTYTDGLGYADAISEAESKELLREAKTAADYLIENASALGVRLYDDVREVFDEKNNKTCEEALFIVTHSSIPSYNPRGNYFNRAWKHSGAYNANTAGIFLDGLVASYSTEVNGLSTEKLAKCNCYMEPSKYMLDLYVPGDLRYEAFFNDVYYVNKATDETGTAYTWSKTDANRYGLDEKRVGNPAYNVTIGDTAVYLSRHTWSQEQRDNCRYALVNLSDNYADPERPLKFFPSLKKGDCPSLYAGQPNKPYSSADCIIYRLGETYLLSAEIEWRLGNPSASRINTIRNRACKARDNSMDITASQIDQDFLLDEYAREMIGEWNRWMTLKRFRAFESRVAKANKQIKNFNKNVHYLRPIPNSEMLLLDNAEEYQNPGY